MKLPIFSNNKVEKSKNKIMDNPGPRLHISLRKTAWAPPTIALPLTGRVKSATNISHIKKNKVKPSSDKENFCFESNIL